MVQDVEHRTFLIDADFQSGFHVKGDITDQHTESDGNQQHRLKFLGYCQVYEEQTYQDHSDMTCRCIGKARVRPEVGKVVS